MTDPELSAWPERDHGAYRRAEVTAVIGHGPATWERASREVLLWRVKTASGFNVDSGPVASGQRLVITARVLGIRISEPVQVVAVVAKADRVGFAYQTRPGHPVDGEEAFIVHRDGDIVSLTVRSLTRPAQQQPWRLLYPALRVAQTIAKRRYLRALR